MGIEEKAMRNAFGFSATGIGSVPFKDVRKTCRHILENCPEIPFWPQFVQRSHLEDLSIQVSQGLPFIEFKEEQRAIVLTSGDIESALVAFYDQFLAEDIQRFAVGKEYAPGLYEMVAMIQENPEAYGPYIKGQSVGPVTFAAAITDHDGKSLLHNPDLLEALVKALAIRALWQVRKLRNSGKRPIMFLDEPYLSGYGSAFSPVQRHEIITLIKEVMGYVRKRSDALIGIHCCGNTDWPMIIETGPDIISFDAFSYMDTFLLYPKELCQFLDRDGTIAWGIVPTTVSAGKASVESLFLTLQGVLNRFHEWGLDPERVARHSLLTPACGMGTMQEASAEKALDLLSLLSKRCRDLG
ncbi:MAG: hypothetical protein PVG99_01485 [Desulfobacteraceae bacterium]|jgi:hypothetical protein